MGTSLERQEATFNAFVSQMKQIGKLFGYTPHNGAGWDIEQFGTIFTALRALLPFQEGDRIELIANPKLSGTWCELKHFLRKGEEGIVRSIELYQGKLSANIEFDNETWIDSKGKIQPVSMKHVFGLPLDIIRKMP